MSRCFPFPPPNYCKERDLRLTESIKKEQESLSKEKRKDKKRERKEKKNKSKDGSEKSKHSERSHKKQKLNDNDAMHLDSEAQFKKKLTLIKDGYNNNATELLKSKLQTKDERSGITEERALRVVTPEPCESSESTENSSKAGRKLEANNTNHSNSILRFKLPSQKQKDHKPAVAADLPCSSGKIGSRIIETTQANEEPCFTGPKTTKIQKKSSASEATYFVGRTTTEPKVLKASPVLPSNGAPPFSTQPAPKPKGKSVLPTSEAARYSGRAIPKPKVEVPFVSGRAAPKPIVLKSSSATEAVKSSGRSLSEPKSLKATPAPRFSDRVMPKPEVPKVPLASKANLKPEALKALPTSKANRFSNNNLPKPKAVATPANETPCFSSRPSPMVSRASLANGTPGFSGQTSKSLAATPLKDVPCFSGRPSPMVSRASLANGTPGFSGQTSKSLVATPLKDAPCSSGHAAKEHVMELESNERKSKRSKKHHDDPERKFKELMMNWKPEPLVVRDEEDLGWLFDKSTKQSKVKSDVAILDAKSCAESVVERLRHINPAYAFQPKAQYLPEVDMYALPYAVPF